MDITGIAQCMVKYSKECFTEAIGCMDFNWNGSMHEEARVVWILIALAGSIHGKIR